MHRAVKRCVGQYRFEFACRSLDTAVQFCIALYRAVQSCIGLIGVVYCYVGIHGVIYGIRAIHIRDITFYDILSPYPIRFDCGGCILKKNRYC